MTELEQLQEEMARASANIAYIRSHGIRGLTCRSHKTKSLYFALCGDAVKIGVSAEPCVRIEALQTGAPGKLKLLAEIKGAGNREAECHKTLQHLHIAGEWFRYAPEIDIMIAELSK